VTRAIDHLLDAFANHLAKEAPTGIPGVDLITSLPLHPRRLRRRGFNQADLLAKRIADARCLPFMHNILTRIHDTLPQASLTGEARRHNVQGAFAAARLPRPNLRIAVVDDVLTTGSSLAAAADALLEAGALEVVGITLAATLPARARRPQMR
jgi:ComF family protein